MFHVVGPWIAKHRLLCIVAWLFGVVANLCFFSVAFSRLARRLLVPDAFCLHMMVLLLLNIFRINAPQLPVYAQWLVKGLMGESGAGDYYVRT
jgi:hypothetical protein